MLRNEWPAITAALLWGVNYPMVKAVLGEIPENSFLIIRFTVSVALFFLLLLLRGESLKVAKEHGPQLLMLGVLGVGVYNLVWTYGIHETTAANAALLISASPIFTGLYSMIRGDETFGRYHLCGTGLAFAGITAIIAGTPGASFSLAAEGMVGNLLVLAGSVLFAVYAILAKPLLTHYSALKLTTLAMLAGLPVIVGFCLVQGPPLSAVYSSSAWAGLGYIIVMGTVAAFVLWYRGIGRSGPFRTVIFHYIVPVVSMVAGEAFLGEPVTLTMVLGGCLVLVGLMTVKAGAVKAASRRIMDHNNSAAK